MIFTANRSDMTAALSAVSMALPARPVMPIYANVLIDCRYGSLAIEATDLEVAIRYNLPEVEIKSRGAAVLPPGRLLTILKESGSKQIDMDASTSTAKLKTNNARYQMQTQEVDDFSALTIPELDECIEMPMPTLNMLLRCSSFAASKEEGKYAMRATRFELEGTTAKAIATDGKRMSLISATYPKECPRPMAGLIPPKCMALLEKITDGKDGVVRIHMTDTMAYFATDNFVVTTRLAEGRFPPYQNVIPANLPRRIDIPADPFLVAIRQAAVMCPSEGKKIEFQFQSGKVALRAAGADTGESDVVMDLPSNQEEFSIFIDPDFLIDFLRHLPPETTFTWKLDSPKKAVLFEIGADWRYMVVPLI